MIVKPNIGLILLVIAVISPATFGARPVLGYSAEHQSPKLIPPPSHLTPTPTPIRTPTPTPRPTSQSAQVFNLDEIYYLSGGGGGQGYACLNWKDVKDDLPANATLPYVTTEAVTDRYRTLCAFGFPPNRKLTVELYTPDGKRAAIFTDTASKGNSALDGRSVGFYMSFGLPQGTWSVVVRGGTRVARGKFTHPKREFVNIEVTHVLNNDVLHPEDPRWRMPHKQGDRAAVYGTGFRANSEITVIVGRRSGVDSSGSRIKLLTVMGWNVQTNSRGDIHIQFPIDRSFKDGIYEVLALPKYGKTKGDEAWPNDFDEYFIVYSPWRACQSGPLSNLHKGETAKLSAGLPNNVRNRPRLSGRRIGQIQAYQFVSIEDGPRCSNGMTWWYVEVIDSSAENNGLKGWTAEGDRSNYWLIP